MDQLKPIQIPEEIPQCDYFLLFVQQAHQTFAAEYQKHVNLGEQKAANYWRGKIDSYHEIVAHYQQLKPGETK